MARAYSSELNIGSSLDGPQTVGDVAPSVSGHDLRDCSVAFGDQLPKRDEVTPAVGMWVRGLRGSLTQLRPVRSPDLQPQRKLILQSDRNSVVPVERLKRHPVRLRADSSAGRCDIRDIGHRANGPGTPTPVPGVPTVR